MTDPTQDVESSTGLDIDAAGSSSPAASPLAVPSDPAASRTEPRTRRQLHKATVELYGRHD